MRQNTSSADLFPSRMVPPDHLGPDLSDRAVLDVQAAPTDQRRRLTSIAD